MSYHTCDAHEKAAARRGVYDSDHCWHNRDEEHDVCCWCGDVGANCQVEVGHHGQYRPKAVKPKRRKKVRRD